MELIGWNSQEQAAEEVWCSIHSSLLSGELVFGYKGLGEISRLVIVKNHDSSYGLGMITSGYTELLPKVPKEYLLGDFLEDLKARKLNKQVIETLKNTI